MKEETALVSACLLGFPCRHDGSDKHHAETLAQLSARGFSIVPICPEVAGGLPIPRPSAFVDLATDRIVDANGVEVTAQFDEGARLALEAARSHGVTLALLKQNSPSCGSHTIGTAQGRANGQGRTAALLSRAGFEVRGEDAPW